MSEQKLRKLVGRRIPELPALLSIFAFIELVILIICFNYSANQHRVKIYNPADELIYEDIYHADQIEAFKKLYSIENFKSEGFKVIRVIVEKKFPTRAWVALSICVPFFLILFIAFIVHIFTDVFKTGPPKSKKKEKTKKDLVFEETRFEKLFSTLGRLNIYALGGTVILLAFLYWMIPDMLLFFGKISYQTIFEFKWILLCICVFAGIYLILRMVLSYRTRNMIIRQQADIQKNRDRMMIEAKLEKKLLENHSKKEEQPD